VKDVGLPQGTELVLLARHHPRKKFGSGQPKVDDWLKTKALQQQEKRLSVTKVLLDSTGTIAGYYTIAPGLVDAELPAELAKKLPRRPLPVAIVAWLGVSHERHGQGLGTVLLAWALRDCHQAGHSFPFVAAIIDCLDDNSKRFFLQFDFRELPGHPYRLYLSYSQLAALLAPPSS
jgi:GNAT superfamily N-acetyltransferase